LLAFAFLRGILYVGDDREICKNALQKPAELNAQSVLA
jgi:hypothetical protein